MMKIVDRCLDGLPLAAAGSALVALVCVFSGSLREMLQRADLELLAGAVALLPLITVLLAFSTGINGRRERKVIEQRTRHARLHATFDTDPRA